MAPLRQATSEELSIKEIQHHYPEFTDRLDQRRKEILGRTDEARAQLNEQVMTSPGDAADESVLDASADYFLKLSNNLQHELLEIRDALERIHQGNYGICRECERPIALERLRKLPYARLCVDDQAMMERSNPLRVIYKI